MDASELKGMKGDDLDAAGVEMKLDRVSRARGHGFDETDDSYRRRLLAEIVGPVAADAMSRPADVGPAEDVGPTVEEWVEAGYRAKNYPPRPYASRSTPEEIAAAISAQEAKEAADDKAKVDAAAMAAAAAQSSAPPPPASAPADPATDPATPAAAATNAGTDATSAGTDATKLP